LELPFDCWRNAVFSVKEMTELKKGTYIYNRGFFSTSKSKEKAYGFNGNVLLKITVRKTENESNGFVDVTKLLVDDEYEVLFNALCSFKVTNIY
jgi:hypothetical protein